MSDIGLAMPEDNPYAEVLPQYYRYVWDVTGIPLEQETTIHGQPAVIITPQVGRVVIYGRLVKEDPADAARMAASRRVFGEWFSPLCPQGELGTVDSDVLELISAEDFSAAFQRNWAEA